MSKFGIEEELEGEGEVFELINEDGIPVEEFEDVVVVVFPKSEEGIPLEDDEEFEEPAPAKIVERKSFEEDVLEDPAPDKRDAGIPVEDELVDDTVPDNKDDGIPVEEELEEFPFRRDEEIPVFEGGLVENVDGLFKTKGGITPCDDTGDPEVPLSAENKDDDNP